MPKPTRRSGVLADHKRVGKALVPPMMQLPNLQTFSYVDVILPNIVWLAPFFMRLPKRHAIDVTIAFLRTCEDALSRDDAPPLAHMQGSLKLSEQDRASIKNLLNERGLLPELVEHLKHQHTLLDGYPFSFIFDEKMAILEDRETSIDILSEEVAVLLDRYSQIATEVQVTAVVAMISTGKLSVSRDILSPDDFDAIFVAPDSAAAARTASFARASINAGVAYEQEGADTTWAQSFWHQVYKLRGCQ